MPASTAIHDYEIFENPRWYLEKSIDNIKEKEDVYTNQKSKFIL